MVQYVEPLWIYNQVNRTHPNSSATRLSRKILEEENKWTVRQSFMTKPCRSHIISSLDGRLNENSHISLHLNKSSNNPTSELLKLRYLRFSAETLYLKFPTQKLICHLLAEWHILRLSNSLLTQQTVNQTTIITWKWYIFRLIWQIR